MVNMREESRLSIILDSSLRKGSVHVEVVTQDPSVERGSVTSKVSFNSFRSKSM